MKTLSSEFEEGMALLEAGDFPASLQSLQGVMNAVPGNEQVGRALVRLARGAGQAAMRLPLATDEARQLYECALSAYLACGTTIADPIDCGLLRTFSFNLGCHFAGRKIYVEAIQHYRDAWILGPDHEDTPNNLSQALINDGQPLEALALLREAMARHPHSPVLALRKQQALKAAGQAG